MGTMDNCKSELMIEETNSEIVVIPPSFRFFDKDEDLEALSVFSDNSHSNCNHLPTITSESQEDGVMVNIALSIENRTLEGLVSPDDSYQVAPFHLSNVPIHESTTAVIPLKARGAGSPLHRLSLVFCLLGIILLLVIVYVVLLSR